ncbi:hypothetical protein OGAPHI_000336 [Ogataea philodendri]|uniref:Uncharacterized protein n=1 Tax=Ogataea philodendri TaxID=1378263 RepID=A0A9P8TB03_9ASCO|nr:uncharacterized protein OGAPHI_000336 [Ogataea philodendri]KAH3671631.1 hypothetical protein OGAPHI_000336 [Ogataea philodendri]
MNVMSEGSGFVFRTGGESGGEGSFCVMVLADSHDLFVGSVRLGLVLTVQQDDVLRSVVELLGEERLQDVLGTLGISDLGIDNGSGVVRSHGVTSTVLVGHGSPWVVLWSWLREPDVSTVASELARLDCGCNVLSNTDGTSGGVDQPGALLEVLEQVCVDQALGSSVQWTVDRDNVGLRNKLLQVLDSSGTNLFFGFLRQRLVVVVQQLLRVERKESFQDSVANSSSTNGGNNLTFDVKGVLGNLGDVPAARDDLLVGRNKVSHQHQDGHHNVLGNRNNVRSSHLENGNVSSGLVDVVQVDVVGSNTSNNQQLEVLSLLDSLLGDVGWMERSGDDDVCIRDVLLQSGVRALLVGSDDQLMALLLEPVLDSKGIFGTSIKSGFVLGVLSCVVEN